MAIDCEQHLGLQVESLVLECPRERKCCLMVQIRNHKDSAKRKFGQLRVVTFTQSSD